MSVIQRECRETEGEEGQNLKGIFTEGEFKCPWGTNGGK